MTGFAAINDQRLTAVRLRVPARGAWTAECDFETDPAVSGRVLLTIGGLALAGTIAPEQSGAFGSQRKARVVAGAGAWRMQLGAKAYHNDAGIKARLIADELAREVGESIGQFFPAAERIGVDYARDANCAAAGVLEDVIGAVAWWVDFEGVTHIGGRPTPRPLLNDDFQVYAYDPRERVAVLSVTDPALIAIGSVLSGPALPEPLTVREYQVQADAAAVRVLAWCDASLLPVGRLAGLWRAVTARAVPAELWGLYLYRVVSMTGPADGRVHLQAVHREIGLPDVGPIRQWPGVAGVHAELSPGAEVLVGFVAGDRSRPVVTHYAGLNGEGFRPVTLSIDAIAAITIGGVGALPAARLGDAVQVTLPPAEFSGTIGGVAASGTVTWTPPAIASGTIVGGSTKVKIA